MAGEPETIEVTSDRVACDGGGGALGHPLVYLTIGEDGEVVCGYCGRRYVRKGHPAIAAGMGAVTSDAAAPQTGG